jgi:hypothetical protein
LDLGNFRTVHQLDEERAISALIGIEPEWFWALMESLLDDGYSPTENIIVLKTEKQSVVKEGNRRIAALKLILGLQKSIEVPDHIQERIKALSSQWKSQNATVPCAVYGKAESGQVDKLIARTHAKGQKAGRSDWPAVATARYAREQSNASEPGLDLLEKYLSAGKNLTAQQAERWAGEYPITVLNEAIQKIAAFLNLKSASDLVSVYPTKYKRLLDQILHDIGLSQLGFKDIRAADPFVPYGLSAPPSSTTATSTSSSSSTATGTQTKGSTGTAKAQAFASNDPRSVRQVLKQFKVRGNGRDKIVTLLNEIRKLKLEDTPHAFCFLLRSMFELSAKAYCVDQKKSGGPSMKSSNGKDKSLAKALSDIRTHLTSGGADAEKLKALHGAATELAKSDGLLSVTSMNQLVHHPSFSVTAPEISMLFHRVFPLLQEMNS